MFKVNNKNNRATSLTSFGFFIVNLEHVSNLPFSSNSISDFEQVSINWVVFCNVVIFVLVIVFIIVVSFKACKKLQKNCQCSLFCFSVVNTLVGFLSYFSRLFSDILLWFILFVNPFHATGVILYPLKTSENLWFSDIFRGYRERPVTWNGLTQTRLLPFVNLEFL